MHWRILEFLGKRKESKIKDIAKNIRVPEVIIVQEIERMKKEGLIVVEGENVKIVDKGIKELQKHVKGVG